MDKRVSLMVSENGEVVISSAEFELAYIRNIFESKNMYQLIVLTKGCHDTEPFKEGLVMSSRDTLEEAKEDMNRLIRGMIDTTGIEVMHINKNH